jgi:hypothetical protein
MKKFLISFIALALFAAAPAAEAANKPCSGKKGGVAGCTAQGKFLCKDGSVSASKRQCNR